MQSLVSQSDWLRPDIIFWSVIGLIVIVPSLGGYLYKWRKAELEANLKSEMIARGMSADEIERVLVANASGKREC